MDRIRCLVLLLRRFNSLTFAYFHAHVEVLHERSGMEMQKSNKTLSQLFFRLLEDVFAFNLVCFQFVTSASST